MLKDYQSKILDLLEQLELEISNLYKLFSEKFPDQQDLWKNLSAEEIQHTAYIKKLRLFEEEGKLFFDEKMTKTFTVQSVMDDIKNKYKKTEDNQYSAINALSFSLSIEQSIIEHKFYDFFQSNDTDVLMTIRTIKEETFLHESKVKEALEEEKKHH